MRDIMIGLITASVEVVGTDRLCRARDERYAALTHTADRQDHSDCVTDAIVGDIRNAGLTGSALKS